MLNTIAPSQGKRARFTTIIELLCVLGWRWNLTYSQFDEQPEEIDVGGRDFKVGLHADQIAGMKQAIPLGRGGTPEEAAGAVYLLCTPESDYISGQVLVCAGGWQG